MMSRQYKYLYFSTLSNAVGYLIGIGFGLMYCDKNIRLTLRQKFNKKTYWPVYLGILLVVLYITAHPIGGLQGAILGSLLKPVNAFAICLCCADLLFKETSKIRRMFEHRIVQSVAKVTYCTYIFHFAFIFYRTYTTSQLVEISVLSLIGRAVIDILAAFALGTVMCLISELPAQKLQKLYVPQTRRSKASDVKTS